VNLDIAEND